MSKLEKSVDDLRLQMYDLLTEESYMKPLLDMAFGYFQNPIMVADHIQHLVDYRQDSSLDSHKWQSVIDSGEYDLSFIDSTFFSTYSQVTQTREAVTLEVDGYTYYQCSIICNSIFMGSVCLLAYDHPIDENDLLILKTLAEIFSVRMAPTVNLTNELERRSDRTLVDLLEGKIKRMSDLRYRLRIQHWEEKSLYAVALFRTREKGEGLSRHIRQCFAKLHPGYKSLVYGGYLLVLLEQNTPGDIDCDFEDFCKHYNLRAGISRLFGSLLDISDYYIQAQKALDYSYKKKEVIIVAKYRNYVVEDMAHRLSLTDGNKRLFHPAVETLAEYDQTHNTDFSETFYTYIEQNRSITRTSKKLFQHKNTVNYRIQRIKHLLGVDLDDFNELVHIYTTYKMQDQSNSKIDM